MPVGCRRTPPTGGSRTCSGTPASPRSTAASCATSFALTPHRPTATPCPPPPMSSVWRCCPPLRPPAGSAGTSDGCSRAGASCAASTSSPGRGCPREPLRPGHAAHRPVRAAVQAPGALVRERLRESHGAVRSDRTPARDTRNDASVRAHRGLRGRGARARSASCAAGLGGGRATLLLLLQLLSPLAPHAAEELWARSGQTESIGLGPGPRRRARIAQGPLAASSRRSTT